MPVSPTVSVVMPAYNRARTIRAAVESVLRQTYGDFEFLVVDDGSADGTLQALDGLSDPRLRLLSNPRNMGASAARNTGIRHARGRWIAFHDSDDEWLPRKLEKQMAGLDAAGRGHIAGYCGMATVGGLHGKERGRTALRYVPDPSITTVEGDILPALLGTSFISTQTLIARRDCLEAIGGFDETLVALEDWDCALRLAGLGTFAFVDEPLVLQYFSDNSLTRDFARWATARRQFIDKHRAAFAHQAPVLARHYRIIAGEQRRLGDFATARQAISQARRLRPLAPNLWAISGYLWLRGLIGRG